MSNQQNDHYTETYWDAIEEAGTRHQEEKKACRSPFELISDADEMIFNLIKHS